MRIGELSARSGLTRDTIRFYERNGLLTSAPGEEATNNYRDYSEHTLMLLQFLHGAREAGLSIADLRELSEALDKTCAHDVARQVIQAKIDDLARKAGQIAAASDYLKQALAGL